MTKHPANVLTRLSCAAGGPERCTFQNIHLAFISPPYFVLARPSCYVEELHLAPSRPTPPFKWPLWLNLLLVLLTSLVLLPSFLHDPNLTLITIFLLAGLGLNLAGAVLALGLGRWRVAGWFGLGMLFIVGLCWVATHFVPAALMQQQ